MDNENVAWAQKVVAGAMDDILAIFKPGARITVMVRRPEHPERDFLMTNDELAEAAALIQRRMEAGPS